MKFCFIPIRVSANTGVIMDAVEQIVRHKLETKKTYARFAEVPVTPHTLVLRVDREKGRKTLVWECAHSKLMTINGKQQRYYKTSFKRKNRIEFFL